MNLSGLHRRLLVDVLTIGTPYPLVITGGYAVQAHGLADRLSQDLDVATENPTPMNKIIRTLSDGLAQRGRGVRQIETDPLTGRLIVTDTDSGDEYEADVLKEAFWSPPATTEHGPVLSLHDVIGTKVRALAAPPPTSKPWAAATPESSSASTTCATASSAPSGGTTRTTPATA